MRSGNCAPRRAGCGWQVYAERLGAGTILAILGAEPSRSLALCMSPGLFILPFSGHCKLLNDILRLKDCTLPRCYAVTLVER